METNLLIFITMMVFLYQLYKIAAKAADFLVETTKAAFIFIILLVLFSMYQHRTLDTIPPIIEEDDPHQFFEDTTYNYTNSYIQI
jgi:hypothetical protein